KSSQPATARTPRRPADKSPTVVSSWCAFLSSEVELRNDPEPLQRACQNEKRWNLKRLHASFHVAPRKTCRFRTTARTGVILEAIDRALIAMSPPGNDWEAILDFWLGTSAADGALDSSRRRMWFGDGRNYDAEIRGRFGELHERATRGRLTASWAGSARS